MIRLAIAPELLKLRRQRAALFWGFLFIPLFMTLLSFLLGGGLIKPPPGATVSEIQLFRSAVRTLGISGNPVAQLFYAVGAAAIFAVEYRYSGWRHLVPRASRESLILSKFGAYKIAVLLSLLIALIGDVLGTYLLPLVQGLHPVVTGTPPGAAGILILSFLISLAELLALSGLVALIATVTRSAMAAILTPFMISIAAAAAAAYLGEAVLRIPLPGYAADALRQWLAMGGPAPLLPFATLIGWIAAPLGGAIAIFRRQDLVSE